MDKLVLHPTSMAQWHHLVNEAIFVSGVDLSEDLESYLVFLLMRFVGKPELAASVLALDYLQTQQKLGEEKCQQLRDVGDKCLLFSGLFPRRAERRRVRVSYFVELGQSSYGVLSDYREHQLSDLFAALSQEFVAMMDVLQSFSTLADNEPLLTPLQATELWLDTNSEAASQFEQKLFCPYSSKEKH